MQSSNGNTGDHVSLFPRGVVIKGGLCEEKWRLATVLCDRDNVDLAVS